MQSRLDRAQRAAKSRRNLVQRRTREETESTTKRCPSGKLATARRTRMASSDASAERSGVVAVHGTWPSASGAEDLATFWCRRPFKNRCRRMPYSQVENWQRPSKRAKDRHASTRVSCARSSAQWPSLPRASAQRHRRAACCSASRSKAIASPAWARSINSRSSSSGVFTVPVIPLLPPKGSLARKFLCEFPAKACLNGGNRRE